MENALMKFEYQQHEIRTVTREDGETLFVANDVCDILDIGNSRQALSRLDDDQKGVITTDTLGGNQDMNVVTESGLYELIFRSNKPEAKAFRKWVTSDVLPSIRKTGKYELPEDMRRTLRDLQGKVEELAREKQTAMDVLFRVISVKADKPLTPEQRRRQRQKQREILRDVPSVKYARAIELRQKQMVIEDVCYLTRLTRRQVEAVYADYDRERLREMREQRQAQQ